jgi:hypothetical protein
LPSAVVSEANSVSWVRFLFLFLATIITSYIAIVSPYGSVIMEISRHDRAMRLRLAARFHFLVDSISYPLLCRYLV